MRKALLIALGVVAVLLLVGGGVIAWLAARVDEDQMRAILAQRLADALGREVMITGHLDLQLGLSPSITVRGVSVANATWGTSRTMLELGQVEATLELLPLLGRRVSVSRLKLVDAKAWLETDAAGHGNWELGGGGGTLPWFYQVEVERMRLVFRDGVAGVARELSVDRAIAGVDKREGQLSLTVFGALDGNRLELSGTVGPLAALLEGGNAVSIDLAGKFHGIRLVAKGSLVEPRALRGVTVALHAAADDTAGLAKLFGRPLPPLGAWRAAARLDDRSGKLALRGITASVGRRETILLSAKGDVEDLLSAGPSYGLRLDVLLEGADTAALGQAMGATLPAFGAFQGTARIEDRGGVLSLPALDVAVGGRELVSIVVRGSVARPLAPDGPEGMALDASVEGTATEALSLLLGTPVPKVGAFRVSGRLEGSTRALAFSGLAATVGSSDLLGDGKLLLTGARPQLEAKLDSKRLDIAEWQPRTAPPPAPRRGQVFSTTPIPLAWISLLDLAVKLRADDVRLPDLSLSDVALELGLADGVLTVQPSSASLYGGRATIEGGVDRRGPLPALRTKLSARGLDAGVMSRALGSTDRLEGRLDVTLDVNGRGATPRALAAGLNGKAAATLSNGRIGHRHLELIAADLTRVLLPGGGESDTAIGCAVGQFDIRGGVATAQALLVDTKRVTVTGSGTVNLGSEALALRLDPKPKEASLLSLAHPMLIGGSLSAPTVRPDPLGVAKGLGGAALGLALGPIGLIIPFVSGGTGEANPCAKLLSGGR